MKVIRETSFLYLTNKKAWSKFPFIVFKVEDNHFKYNQASKGYFLQSLLYFIEFHFRTFAK